MAQNNTSPSFKIEIEPSVDTESVPLNIASQSSVENIFSSTEQTFAPLENAGHESAIVDQGLISPAQKMESKEDSALSACQDFENDNQSLSRAAVDVIDFAFSNKNISPEGPPNESIQEESIANNSVHSPTTSQNQSELPYDLVSRSSTEEMDDGEAQTQKIDEQRLDTLTAENAAVSTDQVIASEFVKQEKLVENESSKQRTPEHEVAAESLTSDNQELMLQDIKAENPENMTLPRAEIPMELDDKSLVSKAKEEEPTVTQVSIAASEVQESVTENEVTSFAESEVVETNILPEKSNITSEVVAENASSSMADSEAVQTGIVLDKPSVNLETPIEDSVMILTDPEGTETSIQPDGISLNPEASRMQSDQDSMNQGKKRQNADDISPPPAKRQSKKKTNPASPPQTRARKRANKNSETAPAARVEKHHVQGGPTQGDRANECSTDLDETAKTPQQGSSEGCRPSILPNPSRSSAVSSNLRDVIDLTGGNVTHKKVRRRIGMFPRYNHGNVYIELAHLDEIYSYSFSRAMLEHCSEWFRSNLYDIVYELDPQKAKNFRASVGYTARYELKWVEDQRQWLLQRAPHTTIEVMAPQTTSDQKSGFIEQSSDFKFENTITKSEKWFKAEDMPVDEMPPAVFTCANVVEGTQSIAGRESATITESAPKPPHRGGVPLILLETFDNLFRTYHNISPNIDSNDINTALLQSELLLTAADIYGGLSIVRPHINSIMLQYGHDIYKAILKDPPRWLMLAADLESAPIFKEAIIHTVAKWPSWSSIRKFDELPMSTRNLIMQKVDTLKVMKTETNEKLFLASIRLTHHDVMLDPKEKASFDTWFIVQVWRDWFYHTLTSLNRPGKAKYAAGKIYRLIYKGSDAYLPYSQVYQTLQAFKGKDFAKWNPRDVEEDLGIMKKGAIEIVRNLVANHSMLDIEENGIEYLTCIKVENFELPWTK